MPVFESNPGSEEATKNASISMPTAAAAVAAVAAAAAIVESEADQEDSKLESGLERTANESSFLYTPASVESSRDVIEEVLEPVLSSAAANSGSLRFGMGKNKKDMARAWKTAMTAVVDIEDEIECVAGSPNTSIHIVYNASMEMDSPPVATSSPVLTEATKAVEVTTRTTSHFVIRRNRTRSLDGIKDDDDDGTPSKKMCRR
jgi:hypothetical protein